MFTRVSAVVLTMVLSVWVAVCNCSNAGYIEVRNETGEVMKNVSWGPDIELGDIGIGKEKGEETERFGEYPVYFFQDSIRYRSKEHFEVDARTSATFRYRSLDDVENNE